LKKNVFSRDELLRRLAIAEAVLREWEDAKLIKPFGYSDDRMPIYADETIAQAERIKKLFELGYDQGDIQKIIRKVGLPRMVAGKASRSRPDEYLTIGALAEKVGVSTRTIKFWEDKGIIEPDMRSQGGFRFYADVYVYLCNLIKDLQLFGYSLDSIKKVSNLFRDFLAISENPDLYPALLGVKKLEIMLGEIGRLFGKINQFKDGIQRWEELLKKKKKDVVALKGMIQKKIPKTEKEVKNG